MHVAARVVGPMPGGKLPPPSAEEKKEKICREAGMCVHEGDGVIIGRMVGRFKTALKRSFPKSIPARRNLLLDGFIVARFIGTSAGEVVSEIILHAGHLVLSPYKPCLTPMWPRARSLAEQGFDESIVAYDGVMVLSRVQ